MLGPVSVSVSDALGALFGRSAESASPMVRLIVRQIRLPRVLLGLLVGCALAVSGTAMQGLFRNPLASPYVLGIASGASTGAALTIFLGADSALLLPLAAFAGGGTAVAVVYALSRGRDRRTSVFTLILAGVAVGAFFSAVTSLLVFLSSGGERLTDVLFWIMGGLGRANWLSVSTLAPIVAVGAAIVILLSRDLNALAFGEEGAFHLGVHPETLARLLLVVTTILTSAAVAMAGTIGFIGLVVPHIMRLIFGSDHRVLVPVSAVAGACFLVWSDIAARTIVAPVELPVGIVTAFLGAPFFLYLLRTRGARL